MGAGQSWEPLGKQMPVVERRGKAADEEVGGGLTLPSLAPSIGLQASPADPPPMSWPGLGQMPQKTEQIRPLSLLQQGAWPSPAPQQLAQLLLLTAGSRAAV